MAKHTNYEDDYEDVYEDEYEGDFDYESGEMGAFQIWVRKSPWFAVSGLVHLVLAMIVLTVMVTDYVAPDEQDIITATLPVKPEHEMIEPEPDKVIADKIVKNDEKVEEPVISDSTDEKNETDNNEEFEEAKGDDQLSDSDLTSDSNLDAIGIGGGSGGPFSGRRGGNNDSTKGDTGGTPATETSVQDALLWLKRHQSNDGSWDVDGFHNNCVSEMGPTCDGVGSTVEGDAGVTGLALLAYLGRGYTHDDGSVFAETIKKGLKYLQAIQDDEGYFATEKESHFFMYGHSIATLAMVEAYGMTGQEIFKGSASRGVDMIFAAQNNHPTIDGEKWGWRYFPQGGDTDSSVTGWMVMALKAAKAVDLFMDEDSSTITEAYKKKFKKSFAGALYWFDYVTDDAYYRAGYLDTGSGSAVPEEVIDDFIAPEVGTSIAVLSRMFMGAKRTSAAIRGGAALLNQQLPTHGDPKMINYYYWYYGTFAMYQVGGKYWENWNTAMVEAISGHQEGREAGCGWGSWDPKIAAWGGRGGRVYATAINCLSLEVYYRYGKMDTGNKYK